MVVLLAIGMFAWGIGYVLGDDRAGLSLKLVGWLAWVNQTAIGVQITIFHSSHTDVEEAFAKIFALPL